MQDLPAYQDGLLEDLMRHGFHATIKMDSSYAK